MPRSYAQEANDKHEAMLARKELSFRGTRFMDAVEALDQEEGEMPMDFDPTDRAHLDDPGPDGPPNRNLAQQLRESADIIEATGTRINAMIARKLRADADELTSDAAASDAAAFDADLMEFSEWAEHWAATAEGVEVLG